jgi:hypothetical protein
MNVMQLVLKVRHRPCCRLGSRFRYTKIDKNAVLVVPRLRKDERRTCSLCFGILLHQVQPFHLTSHICINSSCGGAYLRDDKRTGSAPSRSLIKRSFTFAGWSAISLSLKSFSYSVTSFRKLCTSFRDILACSAFVTKPPKADASYSGLFLASLVICAAKDKTSVDIKCRRIC